MELYHRPGTVGFVEVEPMDIASLLPEHWDPRIGEDLSVHGYADVFNERVDYGVALMRGGAKGEVVSTKEVGESTYSEYHSMVTPLKDALVYVSRDRSHQFEEYPYVEIESEEGYNKALEAMDFKALPEDWDPRKKKSGSMWDGHGLYDFRDKPPTKAYGTMEAYELVNMEQRADETLEGMYEDDERLKGKLSKLLKEASE